MSARPRGGRRTALAVVLGAVAFGVVVLAFLVTKNYEVVDEGRLLPYTSANVVKARFFDTFTLYVAAYERPRPPDVLNAFTLAMAAGICLLMLAFLARARSDLRRLNAFFVVGWLGLAYLAVDELLAVHETLGHNMQFLTRVPGVHRPDDLIIAAYVVPALAVFVAFRRLILSSRAVAMLFGAAAGFFLLAGFFDLVGIGIDELLEPLSSLCLLLGFMRLALERLRVAPFAPGERASA